jgi:hypothetical protein
MLLKQGRADLLVPVSRPGEFFRVQRLSEIMDRRPEQNCVPVYNEAGEAGSESIEKLSGGGMNGDQVSDEEYGCPKFFADANSFRRKRKECHIQHNEQEAGPGVPVLSRQNWPRRRLKSETRFWNLELKLLKQDLENKNGEDNAGEPGLDGTKAYKSFKPNSIIPKGFLPS